jgi:hypothetical protein
MVLAFFAVLSRGMQVTEENHEVFLDLGFERSVYMNLVKMSYIRFVMLI